MKQSIMFFGALIILVLVACVPPVVFTEPQPQDFEHQSAFSVIYRGTFFCESDSSIVHVKNKTIYKEKTYPFRLTKQDIDTIEGISLDGNQLYIDSLDLSLPTETFGDSVYADFVIRDTLFQIARDQVLTQFRGHQILNRKLNDGNWEVIILSLDEQMNLVLQMADIPDDLNRLEKITPVKDISKGDTIQYQLSPTVYQFDQILYEQLIFEACDYYTRIVMPIQI